MSGLLAAIDVEAIQVTATWVNGTQQVQHFIEIPDNAFLFTSYAVPTPLNVQPYCELMRTAYYKLPPGRTESELYPYLTGAALNMDIPNSLSEGGFFYATGKCIYFQIDPASGIEIVVGGLYSESNHLPNCRTRPGYQTYTVATQTCSLPNTYQLKLETQQSNLTPSGLSKGKLSSTLLTATVTNGTTGVANVPVELRVEVERGSGAHIHHDKARTLGKLAGSDCGTAVQPAQPCMRGNTDAQGKLEVKYDASELSGTYHVKALCKAQECAGASDQQSIKVGLDGLTELPNSLGNCYTLIDAAGVIGAITGQHTANHWVKPGVAKRLEAFACAYKELVQNDPRVIDKRLFINDASLPKGGRFETHDSHRVGWSIDIRASSSAGKIGEVPADLLTQVAILRKRKDPQLDAQIHCRPTPKDKLVLAFGKDINKCAPYPGGRHFHVNFK